MPRLSRVLAAAAVPVALLAGAPTALRAQAPSAMLSEPQQIVSAVLALPDEFRAGATVLGYRSAGTPLVTLRTGTGPFVCLASDPAASRFHVACYHRDLEPFMARGRALRAQGTTGERVDTVRFAEVRSGRLKMPTHPSSLYTLTGPEGSFDAATGKVTGARPLVVVYMPGATAATTGLSLRPAEGTPWLMLPGTPKAHIMFTPRM